MECVEIRKNTGGEGGPLGRKARKSRLTLFMEVVNVTNRDNYRPNSPFVNFATRRVFEPIETLFPLLPVAGVLIEF